MDKRPKRNRYKDNPYYLYSDKEKNIYEVCFSNKNQKYKVDVTKEVFEELDKTEKNEARIIQYDKRYLEQSYQTDVNLYKKAINKQLTVYETIVKKNEYMKLQKAIKILSPIQKRRILLHFEYNLTLAEIAKIEGCSKVAIKYSIDIAIKKLRKFFEKN